MAAGRTQVLRFGAGMQARLIEVNHVPLKVETAFFLEVIISTEAVFQSAQGGL